MGINLFTCMLLCCWARYMRHGTWVVGGLKSFKHDININIRLKLLKKGTKIIKGFSDFRPGLTTVIRFLSNVDPNKYWKTILFIYCLLSIESQNYKMEIEN